MFRAQSEAQWEQCINIEKERKPIQRQNGIKWRIKHFSPTVTIKATKKGRIVAPFIALPGVLVGWVGNDPKCSADGSFHGWGNPAGTVVVTQALPLLKVLARAQQIEVQSSCHESHSLLESNNASAIGAYIQYTTDLLSELALNRRRISAANLQTVSNSLNFK